ncbi:hypothetical protein Bbelb_397810 [Branchiostoma belcheri]|nr:hypothetical protein Bbelb_397810 [Branchiostoma belcheri]
MDKVQTGVLIFLLVILKVFGPTEAPCSTERHCQFNGLKLTSIPQDLPPQGDILVCEASGIPTPDITVTLPSGLNKTVQSGGRVTENPTTLEPGLEKPTNLTLEPQLDTLRKFTFEPELDQPTSLTLEPARKPESSNGPTDANSNGCTATDNTDNVTVSQGPTDSNSNGCTATDNTDNLTASQDQTVLGQKIQEQEVLLQYQGQGIRTTRTITISAHRKFGQLGPPPWSTRPTALVNSAHRPGQLGPSAWSTRPIALVNSAHHQINAKHKKNPQGDLYNSMDKVQPGVLIFLLVILKVFGPTEAPCSTEHHCQCNRLKLTSIPQDLPRQGDILVCEASGIPTPDITVTLPSGLNKTVQSSGLNKTVQSGGRVTVGANGTIIINVTADADGLYVCTATSPVGSTFASLFVYARQENPKTLEPGLEKPTNLTLEPQLDTLRKLTFEPELDQPTSLTLEPARKPESSNGPTDSNSNDCTATDNTANVTANQDQTVLDSQTWRFLCGSATLPSEGCDPD